MTFTLFDLVGVSGTMLIAIAYFLQQLGKLSGDSLPYLVMNLLGAVLLMISLCVNFNLASFLMEIFWIISSLIGLRKYWKHKIVRP